MIQVKVNNYNNPYEVTCPYCKSIMTFGTANKKIEEDEVFGEWHWSTYIDCPCCNGRIILAIDGIKETDYKCLV